MNEFDEVPIKLFKVETMRAIAVCPHCQVQLKLHSTFENIAEKVCKHQCPDCLRSYHLPQQYPQTIYKEIEP